MPYQNPGPPGRPIVTTIAFDGRIIAADGMQNNGEDARWASGKVILTVAHLNHYPPDCRPENLLALCNTCHLRYDQVLHSHHARLKRRQGKAAGDMFGHVERYDGKALKQQRKKGRAT